jgi:hypothetical protein
MALLALAILLPLSLLAARPALAQCPCNGCEMAEAVTTAGIVSAEHQATRAWFGTTYPLVDGTGELGEHQRFLIAYLFRGDDNIGGILPALMLFTQQMNAVMMEQMWIVGEFLDAKHQLESQQRFREKVARAHKAYRPSTGMCIIGTNVRSLAAAQQNGKLTTFILGQRNLDRQLGAVDTNASDGPLVDLSGRLKLFVDFYCDRYDNNAVDGNVRTGLGLLCSNQPPMTVNNDIDFTKTFEIPRTLYVHMGYAPAYATQDEKDVMEMTDNLFANRTFDRIAKEDLMLMANHDEYLDLRSVVAKRSVALNSFNNVIGMKAAGSRPDEAPGTGSSDDTAQYMRVIMRELGVTSNIEMYHMINDHGSTVVNEGPAIFNGANYTPSYFAQMEVLTKRVFQNPEFFTDLYDTPANVKRKSAALQALNMMLDRDIYDSYIRGEMLMSVLLEIKLSRLQDDVATKLRVMNASEDH